MEQLVEEKKEEISLEEKLSMAFNEVDAEKYHRYAVIMYKKGLFQKEEVKDFNENEYTDVTFKNGYKGYMIYKDKDDILFMVKPLNAEDGEDVYAYDVLRLPKLSDEELIKAMAYKRSKPILTYVLLGFFGFALLLGLIDFFMIFFDSMSAGFKDALLYAYFYSGGYITISLGILVLISIKLKKSCCGRKK